MPPSYRAINYGVRPAKAVERKMMGEAFRRLHPFQRIEEYRYVGFGSIYFADFQLVHCALGVEDMVSIEKDEEAEECFRFNKPYRSIDLRFGQSNRVLPELDWSKRTILWLDYDGKLDIPGLADIDTFCSRCTSGSMIIVSVNAQAESELTEEERKKIESETGEKFDASAHRLRQLVGLIGEKVPPGTQGADLRGKGVANIFRRVIQNQIEEQLIVRNSLLMPSEKFLYRQIFNFLYKDGAQMLTVGGMIFKVADQPLFEACAFDRLPFVKTGEHPYNIRVPCLTPREIRHLNSQLPCNDWKQLQAPGVPASDLEKFSEVYRYFPSFTEAPLS